jgi:uncharacterized membrane protein
MREQEGQAGATTEAARFAATVSDREAARSALADTLTAWFASEAPRMARIEAEALADQLLDTLLRV